MGLYHEDHDVSLSEENEHLLPRYLDDWGEHGRIVLNGEMDFDPTNHITDIHDQMKERAPEVGALVGVISSNVIEVHPGMCPATYYLHANGNGEVDEIKVEVNDEKEYLDVGRFIDISTRMQEVVDQAIENGAIEFGVAEKK